MDSQADRTSEKDQHDPFMDDSSGPDQRTRRQPEAPGKGQCKEIKELGQATERGRGVS